jgi:hypothetical protein
MLSATEIQSKTALSDDELYREVGLALGRGAAVGDPQGRGQSFLASIGNQLQDSICKSHLIRLMHEQQADTMFFVAAIADAVTSLLVTLAVPVSPVTVAVLLFRSGVGNLCHSLWKPEDNASGHS